MTPLDFRNTNALWCSVLAETLVRRGVTHAITSPGSRSTPLTMALVRHPGIEAIPVLDERSAAFFALGLAKQTSRPVVLVCTSGTAGANYFPAVIEAHESGVPLIIITADRPPEMRDCASGQTIDQQKLFGGFMRFYHELAVPEPTLPVLRYLRQTVAHAIKRAADGPVHLNAPFRDPLPPVEDGSTAWVGLKAQDWEAFFAHLNSPAVVERRESVTWGSSVKRGVIVAGPANPAHAANYVAKVKDLSAALGWPVLADVLSPVRHQAAPGEVVAAYDLILRNADLARTLRPEAVLCLGGWPTSKVLRGWLESSEAEICLVGAGPVNRDALHGRTRSVCADIEALEIRETADGDAAYIEAWHAAEVRAATALAVAVSAEPALVEPQVTTTLAAWLPTETPVFVANSMPVRDLEYFWPANPRGVRIHFSRGANGIDGTLSTALGVAHGNRPTVLLTGDLALLHDTNGFLSVRQLRGSLTVVLINNDGGGIFNHLPVAGFNPPFEDYWATPQAVDFGKLCSAYGVEYRVVHDLGHLQTLVAELPAAGVRVLEVHTERARDAAFRKQLFATTAAGLSR